MDMEKVISGLKYCTRTDGTECPNCPYWHDDDCVETLHTDALELIKSSRLIHTEHALYTVYDEQKGR